MGRKASGLWRLISKVKRFVIGRDNMTQAEAPPHCFNPLQIGEGIRVTNSRYRLDPEALMKTGAYPFEAPPDPLLQLYISQYVTERDDVSSGVKAALMLEHSSLLSRDRRKRATAVAPFQPAPYGRGSIACGCGLNAGGVLDETNRGVVDSLRFTLD